MKSRLGLPNDPAPSIALPCRSNLLGTAQLIAGKNRSMGSNHSPEATRAPGIGAPIR